MLQMPAALKENLSTSMRKFVFATIAICLTSCAPRIGEVTEGGEDAPIYPDYRDVTVPDNIAPLNFSFTGEGTSALKINGSKIVRPRKGLYKFSRREWRTLMDSDSARFTLLVRKGKSWNACKDFSIHVSHDKIDPYISYRLIPPGYQGWEKMGIYQRNLENYRETPIYENTNGGSNCCNCHTYCNGNPNTLLFHVRASFGGTMVVEGSNIEKLNTKTDSTISALVYPFWHPDGEKVAFSVNKTFQQFFNHGEDRIEVYDDASDVVVYNLRTHRIAWSPLTKSEENFETYPCFSPDGKWLYFCSAEAVDNVTHNIEKPHYGIKRIAFDAATMSFGDTLETVFDAPALGKSCSYPRVSPDGRYLCFTLHKYGNFAIWHKDADLWMVDLQSGRSWPLEELNSDCSDSSHNWSGSGRWLGFNSRRDDGLYTRTYISHIDENGVASKPFMLPQKDPVKYYKRLLMSYNLPQFTSGKVAVNRRRLVNVMRNSSGTDIGC
mgnify:FL=1